MPGNYGMKVAVQLSSILQYQSHVFWWQSSMDNESITQNQKVNSINNVTISDLNGR
ncbi:hypothetical protein OIU79_020549 [Salix purpurea]|uniref:Uncharacterized protein n=1 Tax=Salix purpurea TaxID=77065 RepID=A0A9Q1AFW5_SALPP|nr:hypothetical protein OIU79_020549 [Salix purpurea]